MDRDKLRLLEVVEELRDILSLDRPITKDRMVELARDWLLESGFPVTNDFRPRGGTSQARKVARTLSERYFLPGELRQAMLEDRAFLYDYAHMSFCGDGMEYEHSAELLEGEDDESLLQSFANSCHDPEIEARLRVVGKARLEAIGNSRILDILDSELGDLRQESEEES